MAVWHWRGGDLGAADCRHISELARMGEAAYNHDPYRRHHHHQNRDLDTWHFASTCGGGLFLPGALLSRLM